MKTVTVESEVVDYHTIANVDVHISEAPASKPQTGTCGINFSLDGDSLVANNSCVDYLAMARVQQVQVGEHAYNYKYDIQLFDAEKVFSPLRGGLSDLSYNDQDNVVTVKTGSLENSKNFHLKLFIRRHRFFFSNEKVLIDRELNSTEFTYEPIDQFTGLVKVDVSKLIGELKNNRRHDVRVSLDVDLPEGQKISGGGMPTTTHQESEIDF
jgi:hypothetical protein